MLVNLLVDCELLNKVMNSVFLSSKKPQKNHLVFCKALKVVLGSKLSHKHDIFFQVRVFFFFIFSLNFCTFLVSKAEFNISSLNRDCLPPKHGFESNSEVGHKKNAFFANFFFGFFECFT